MATQHGTPETSYTPTTAESIAESVKRRLLEDFFTRNNPRLRALAVKHGGPWGDSERLLEVAMQ
jgi:hypothetical protein